MGLWSYYFFAKLFLYYGQFIGFHALENLGFALFTLLPVRARWLRTIKQLVAVPAGVALLYYDSWLPPFKRLLEQQGELAQFSLPYLLELLGRFFNLWVVVGLIVLLVVYWILGHRLRMSTFALLGILSVPIVAALPTMHMMQPVPDVAVRDTGLQASSPAVAPVEADPNLALTSFYRAEALRQVTFQPTELPFDVILIHICSLAWDDLLYTKLQDHPLLAKFDLLFDNFNSAASYSGPAAIRLLRGSCGHPKHPDLYRAAAPNCYAFNAMRLAGFEPQFLMNHDGHFGDFIGDVRANGGLTVPPFDNRQAPVRLRSFDNSPIYSDYELLASWWQQRLSQPAPRVALYYNSVTPHDGNHYPDRPNAPSRDTYAERTLNLLDDLNKFLELIGKSGRYAAVVFVPEHGAAIRGDRFQIPGLREIPSPAISRVPVGIKLVGRHDPTAGATIKVHEPMSYLGLFELIARLMAKDAFAVPPPPLADYLKNLPQTEAVAENEDNVVMRIGARYLMRNLDLTWTEYPTAPVDER